MARITRHTNRRGNYAIITALSSTAMLGFGALAVDASYMRLAAMQAQNAADAGAHAGLVQLRTNGDVDDARGVAEEVINMNKLLGKTAKVDSETDVVFGGWDFDLKEFDEAATYVNAVEVTVRKTEDSPNGAIDLMMMKMWGTEHAETASSRRAIGALRYREIFIVQDVTGSFAGVGEIDSAAEANLEFLDYLDENNFPGDRIGMITFVGDAEIWTDLEYIEEEYASIRSTWETLTWCDRSYWPWPYYYGGAYAHYASWMMGCNEGSDPSTWYYDSGTSQGSGIELAVDALIDDDYADPHALKTIVLISDGKPQCIPSSTSCDNAVAAYGLEMADYAEDNNVSIYSVSYNQNYNATQSAYMESLARGYGKFYETPDPQDLPAILEEIATAIPIALVQ